MTFIKGRETDSQHVLFLPQIGEEPVLPLHQMELTLSLTMLET